MSEPDKIRQAMRDLAENDVMEMLRAVMDEGGEEAPAALEALQEGMKDVGELYESGEYFVGDLIYSGEIMTEAVKIISPALNAGGQDSAGKLVLCTVKGDIHDIGKGIVKTLLEASGFEVMDLGIDVSPEVIVKAVNENNIKIVALSGVLTLALDSMKNTVQQLKESGLRDSVKVVIGGAPVTADACTYIGADAWALNAQTTVNYCNEWTQ